MLKTQCVIVVYVGTVVVVYCYALFIVVVVGVVVISNSLRLYFQ